MKCFGRNDYGQLGRGDRVNYIGDNTNELGDNLSPVLLGTGFSASGLHLPRSFGQFFGFAFEEAATGLLLKGNVPKCCGSISVRCNEAARC